MTVNIAPRVRSCLTCLFASSMTFPLRAVSRRMTSPNASVVVGFGVLPFACMPSRTSEIASALEISAFSRETIDTLLQRGATAPRILLFPLFAVDGPDRYLFDRTLIEATHVDTEAIRVRARHIKGLDTANRTEQMLRGMRVELVGRQKLGAREQLESRLWNGEVQVTRLAADGAVAIRHLHARGCDYLEPCPSGKAA